MAINTVPEGLIPPVLTPLTADQKIDIPAFRALLDSVIKGGASAVFVGGTAGLGSVLCEKDYELLVTTALETVPENYPVLCGVLEPSTVRAAERIKLLESLNIRHFVTVTPYYIKTSDYQTLLRHFGHLRNQSDMEMVLYNIPICTGVSIPADLIFEMVKRGWTTCCKDSSGDEEYFKNLCIEGNPLGLRTYQGMRPDFPELQKLNAAGCVPVPANAWPELFFEAWESRADDNKNSQLQARIDTVWNELVVGTDYISGSLKALAQKGIGDAHMMLPFE